MDNVVLMFLGFSIGITLISLLGAYLPRIRTLSDRQSHLLVAFAAGIFIGLLLLLLLPEAIEQCESGGVEPHYMMYALIVGFVLIMSIEVWLKKRNMPDLGDGGCGCTPKNESKAHEVTTLSTFVGLSVHSACDGLALAATFLAGEAIGLITSIGMCIHKFVELFSLSSMMLITNMPKRKVMLYLICFAMIAPISGLIFFIALSGVSDLTGMTGIPLAFAAGTFMYVSLCDILPEAFHRRKDQVHSYGLVLLGIVIIFLITVIFPHVD